MNPVDDGQWNQRFSNVGQISESRSTMKSAIALPVVKLNQA